MQIFSGPPIDILYSWAYILLHTGVYVRVRKIIPTHKVTAWAFRALSSLSSIQLSFKGMPRVGRLYEYIFVCSAQSIKPPDKLGYQKDSNLNTHTHTCTQTYSKFVYVCRRLLHVRVRAVGVFFESNVVQISFSFHFAGFFCFIYWCWLIYICPVCYLLFVVACWLTYGRRACAFMAFEAFASS